MSNYREREGFLSVFKGSLTALLVTVIGILTFGLIITFSGLEGLVVKAVNQFIKILSVFLGSFFCLKENKGLIKGLFLGIIYSSLTYLIFLTTGVNITLKDYLIDLLFASGIGILSGIISVNLKK